MKIRSITYFCNPRFPLDREVMLNAAEFLSSARSAYQEAGYEVQSTRLATIPFPRLLGESNFAALPRLAKELEAAIEHSGIGYASLGPALPEWPSSYRVISDAIGATRNVFFSAVIADRRRGLDVAAVDLCARVIVDCASIDPNGFANLRFAALANVSPGSPFFPAAYHSAGRPVFALATEAADLAVQAFRQAPSVDAGRDKLVEELERHGRMLAKVGRKLARPRRGRAAAPRFGGIDFSLAPFPDEARSMGAAFECLGVPRTGLAGSVTAAAILAEAVDRAKFARTGFSGLMLPVLEDATLAARAADGSLSIKDLLLFSAVCGTGLDTIPLPGNATAGQIGALLLDLAALSTRLDKPLTARLLPVPGKKAGDLTGFDFEYFANSRVMALEAEDLQEPLGRPQTFRIRSR